MKFLVTYVQLHQGHDRPVFGKQISELERKPTEAEIEKMEAAMANSFKDPRPTVTVLAVSELSG